jgi:ADP-heptose:LPS heptosyltransferase
MLRGIIWDPLYGGRVPRRILVVKLADLGDLLTTTPALRALRGTFPEARVDALVTPSSAAILQDSDLVDRIVPFDKFAFDRPAGLAWSFRSALALAWRLRCERYDLLLLFHHLTTWFGTAKYTALALASGAPVRVGLDNGRGWFLTHRAVDRGFGARHEVDYWLEVAGQVGAMNHQPRLEITIPPTVALAAAERWASLGLAGEPTVILHPGSGAFSLARRWAAERYSALGDRLAGELGLRVAVLAGPAPGEGELARRVAGEMTHRATIIESIPTPQELAAILRQAVLCIGNDSGVLHLATAVETPVVAIFGPSNHLAWGPYSPSNRNAVVREPVACSPCIHRGHRFGTPEGCPARTCLQIVEVEAVFEAAARVLRAGQTPFQSSDSGPKLGARIEVLP